MNRQLKIAVGQHSDKGRKEINQDFHGVVTPGEPLLGAKGIAVALADGISSSDVSQVASQSAVTGFLEDYYCTPETWSVKTSAERVLGATNSWLHAQTQQSHRRFDRDRGYVCTFSGVVFKSTTAHVVHVGDTRVYRLRGAALDQLTEDHRLWVSSQQSHLARALGMDRKVDIDYAAIPLAAGDIFLLATDGVYEHTDAELIRATLARRADDPDQAARDIVAEALRRGSPDNLTLQIVRILELPSPEAGEMVRQFADLPLPPPLEARMAFDGYRIVRELKASSRSHIHLAVDEESGEQVVIKTPATDLQGDPACLERFLLEEWIARRIDSPHVLKPRAATRQRHHLYVVTEYIEGQTLAQWLRDNPKPDLPTVRRFIEQIARGLHAFHRLEMAHRDIKPDNIMIDGTGTLKIIDFGTTRVAGIAESITPIGNPDAAADVPGDIPYAAPEYFLGETGSARSDQYSLGVIACQMLSGRLPYGAAVPRARTRAAQRKLVYRSVLDDEREIPVWVDDAIRKAVHPDPRERYGELSEFVYDLSHPNQAFLDRTRPPLIERNPALFWKGVSFVLFVAVIALGLHSALRF